MSNFEKCVFHSTGSCDSYEKRKVSGVTDLDCLVQLKNLNHNLSDHSQKYGIDMTMFNERKFIMNRAYQWKDDFSEYDSICAKHRYTLGLFWEPLAVCQSSHHEKKSKPKGRKFLETKLCHLLTLCERYKDSENYFFVLATKFATPASPK